MTTDQARRTRQALTETHQLLSKELSYSLHLQKADRIAFYRTHIAKLEAMLGENRA